METSKEKIKDLIQLNEDFLVNAETYGRIIIMERYLPIRTQYVCLCTFLYLLSFISSLTSPFNLIIK
jgi:hypothetical protein